MDDLKIKDLEKQGYRLVGEHSAVKLCLWCKKAIKSENVCYKEKFYGIKSHRCVQMTPALGYCTHRCEFCWRDIEWTKPKMEKCIDEPKNIVDGCIREHIKYLQGLGAIVDRKSKKFKEALEPNQFAISLSGEPCLYPKLPELVDEIKSRGMTAFLVSNGTIPEMVKKLIKHQPTNMYITLPAPNKEVYNKVCKPLIKDGWEKLMDSLKLLEKFDNSVIRMTLVKGFNMVDPEGYANILKNIKFKFLEIKAGMATGYARYRIKYEDMPQHSEIKDFSEKICKLSNLKIINEKKESRVFLLSR